MAKPGLLPDVSMAPWKSLNAYTSRLKYFGRSPEEEDSEADEADSEEPIEVVSEEEEEDKTVDCVVVSDSLNEELASDMLDSLGTDIWLEEGWIFEDSEGEEAGPILIWQPAATNGNNKMIFRFIASILYRS